MHIIRDTMRGFGMRRPHPDPARLFFSILKFVLFKKLNGAGMRKFSNPSSLHLIFVFIFYLCIFAFLFFLY